MRFKVSSSKGSEADKQLLVGSLYTAHERQVYQLAWNVTKSQDLSNDIVQEVFLKVWEHRDKLGEIDNIEAWLHRIVKNKLIDFLRKVAADAKLKTALWNRMRQAHTGAHELLETKESQALIHQAIEELPEQRKLVFRLNREGGLTYQEIADELSISPHTVKNQVFMALKSLQKKFSFQ